MNFFQFPPYPSDQIQGYYDLKLVLFSYLVAVFASYVALSIACNLRRPSIELRSFWTWFLGGALVMGMGIWTMHFIGMEAFVTYMPIEYDPFLTFLSLLIAVVASGFALYVVARPRVKISGILSGGILMGLAIASMHYVGMTAMLHMEIRYMPFLFILSIIIAIVAAQAALWLMIKSDSVRSAKFNIFSAIVMGAAICGMHYMGMAAAVMTGDTDMDHGGAPVHSGLPTLYLGTSASLIMLIFLALSSNNQKFLMTLQKSNEELRKKEIELDGARKKAEQANLAKSFFLANMSHEIRTPLNVIIGTASLLAKCPLDEKEKKYTDRITLSSKILLNLIMDILDFSKIEAGELKLIYGPTELNNLIKEVVHILSARAEEKHLQLNVNTIESEPINVLTDPIRVQQVITNLVSNAVKFTEKGSVTVNVIKEKPDNEHQLIRLEIVDTGIGIPEDKFDAIFRKFSQVDNSTTRKYGGSGLGLVISKELIRLMGGNIGFTSKLGEGSTFWFEIPFLIDKNSQSASKS